MEINWKFTGTVAAIAFLLSALSAGISGVPFGTLLFRAILMSALGGALATGAYILIKNKLPGLFEFSETKDTESGSNVDIVLDEEGAEYSASDAEEETENYSVEEQAALLQSEEEDRFEEETEYSETQAQYQDGESSPDAEDAELLEEVEEASPAEELSSEDTSFETTDEVDVDRLPDLDNFSDSFVADSGSSDTGEDQYDEAGGDGQDPAVLARAVQTVLKKDE